MISGILAVTPVSAMLAIFIAALASVVVAAIRNPQTTGQRGDPYPHDRIDNCAHDVLLTTWSYNEAVAQAA
jgi:hypothetical protein